MKIYIDFDRTLFDCDRFLEDLYALINQYHITKSVFKECQNQCKRKGFNPYIILDLIKEKYQFNEELYHKIELLMKDTRKYLYPDTLPFLEYLKSHNYEIIILTKGNSDYQREKIFNAHIDTYYNKLIVTMKHKGKLNIDYQNSCFIDDNPNEILSILDKNPKKIIRIQRENTKYFEVPMDFNIKVVKTLDEIIKSKILD